MGLGRRLYQGETNFDFIGARKRWYLTSAVLLLICVGSMVFNQFNLGIEFSGGTSFTVSKPADVTLEEAEKSVEDAGAEVQTGQEAGSGSQTKFVIKTARLSVDDAQKVKVALADRLGVQQNEVTDDQVSSSWGDQVTNKALIALAVFLVVVGIYLWIRFEQKMALAALFALVHDLALTAGVYSIIGFEVTPSTIVGLLTILGFSLYDTVVVFDRVTENTRGLLGGTRMTYGEAANKAVNETLMRSINTSLISLLPVAGLLFVGAGLLGVGTLKDLALVLFVGMLTGAYSSLFLATPWLVDLKEREPRYKALKQRVLARRAGQSTEGKVRRRAAARKAAESDDTDADETTPLEVLDEDAVDTATDEDDESREPAAAGAGSRSTTRSAGDRPGQQQRRRTGGKPGRPSGSKRRR